MGYFSLDKCSEWEIKWNKIPLEKRKKEDEAGDVFYIVFIMIRIRNDIV